MYKVEYNQGLANLFCKNVASIDTFKIALQNSPDSAKHWPSILPIDTCDIAKTNFIPNTVKIAVKLFIRLN